MDILVQETEMKYRSYRGGLRLRTQGINSKVLKKRRNPRLKKENRVNFTLERDCDWLKELARGLV